MDDTSPEVIAQWMLNKIEQERELYQSDAAYDIAKRFGERFIYENDNGNPAIDKKVLRAFNRVSGNNVVWERGGRYWRLREDTDQPGRQQE